MLNSSLLMRHAIAFALYLVSTTLWAIAVIITNIANKQWTMDIYFCVSIGDFIVQFIAQWILLEIFWEWGTKTVEDKLDE